MFFIIKEYCSYFFKSHFLFYNQSDFIVNFKNQILQKAITSQKNNQIHLLRTNYLENNIQVKLEDYGAGSKTKKKNEQLFVSDIIKNISVKKKYGNILYNLSSYYNTKKCLELGTSLGFGSAYLATESNKITSIEGNTFIAELAKKSLLDIGLHNINIISAKFDDEIDNILKETRNFDLIFIDGNHSEEATLRYYKKILNSHQGQTIIIFDDIYWSFGMKNAWNTIRTDKNIQLTIDLFQFGIVFLNTDLKQKEHHTLWY